MQNRKDVACGTIGSVMLNMLMYWMTSFFQVKRQVEVEVEVEATGRCLATSTRSGRSRPCQSSRTVDSRNGRMSLKQPIPKSKQVGCNLRLLLAHLVAARARVATAAFICRPPLLAHVPDVRLVPEMFEEAVHAPYQSDGSVLAPIACAEDEEWHLRVRRGTPHEVTAFCAGADQEPSARPRQVVEDDRVGSDVSAFSRQTVLNRARVDNQSSGAMW